jgi:hypothetical protein
MNFVIQSWRFRGLRRKYWMVMLVFCAVATLVPFILCALAAQVFPLIAAGLGALPALARAARSSVILLSLEHRVRRRHLVAN